MIRQKTDYDAIVVGCGPAGAWASKKMAEAGLSVYCIDKRAELGAPVRCGEGLAAGWFDKFGIEPTRKITAKEIFGYRAVAPNGNEIVLKDPKRRGLGGYVLERKMFDKYIGILASRAGALIDAKTMCTGLVMHNSQVKGIKAEHQGESFELTSQIVVAADGVDSKVARYAGLNTANKLADIDSGAEYEMSNIQIKDPELIEFYFGSKISPGGYIWVFPKDNDVANVGIGIRANLGGSAVQLLNSFVQSRPELRDGSIIEVKGGGVPVGGVCDRFTTDGLMLVGDAAHQVNPIHGGGIGLGMASAEILAKVAAEAIKANNFSDQYLSRYKRDWDAEYGAWIRKLLKLRMFQEKLTDEQVNMLSGILKGDDLFDLASGNYLKIAKFMLTRAPQIGRLAMSLLI